MTRRTAFGSYGATVALERRRGVFYLRWWEPSARQGKGGFMRRSLRHSDRPLAEQAARELAATLLSAARAQSTGALSAEVLFARYDRDVLAPALVARPGEYRAVSARWIAFLGAGYDVRRLDRPTLDRFVQLRRTGQLFDLKPVRERTVGADLEHLRTVLNWATTVTLPDGRRLLDANPVRGHSIPTTAAPRRPVASYDRFLAIREHADVVDAQRRFGLFMDLIEGLGWRVTAICKLAAADVDRKSRPNAPYGRIRKRRQSDKQGVDQWVPLREELRVSLDRVPVLAGWLFPSPRNAMQPWSRWHARALHDRAQAKAQIEPLEGSCFHAYRRKWATERKHLPDVDVAAAGGWTDVRALKTAYQQVDDATLLAVINEPKKLREVSR